MAIGRVGIRQNVNLLLDSDAQAFITAAGLSSDTHKNAVNELVKDLKSANIWTKMKAVYPFVGGTATTHKWNLKDPRDVNAAFRLSFYGGGTHGPNGYQPNGTDAYANTWLIPNAQMTASTSHASYYSRTNYYTTSERWMIGVGYTRLSSYLYNIYGGLASPWVPQGTPNNSGSTNGFFLVNRSPDNVVFISKNGSVMNSLASGTAGFEGGYIYLGAMNWGGAVTNAAQGFTFNECAFSSFGSNFTTAELSVYYRIVEKYQVALGRSVNAALPFYYNNSYSLNTNLFIINAGITDPTQISAVGTLVNTLTTAGIWTKMKAVYPFVGGNATAHKFNLVNPVDTDAGYRLLFNGGGTHGSGGYNPGGVNGYADTRLLPYTILNSSSYHISYYSRNNIIGDAIKYVMGSTDINNKRMEIQSWAYPATAQYYDMYPSSTLMRTGPLTNSKGLIMMDRQTSSLAKAIINGSVLSTNSSASTTLPNTNNPYIPYLWVGSSYRATVSERRYTNIECAFASIGDGLTDAEALTFYNAVQAFQTTLSRQV